MESAEISKILVNVERELLDTFDHKEENFRNDWEYDQLQNFINGEYNARLRSKLDELGYKLDDLSDDIQRTIRIKQGTFVQIHLAKLGKKD